MIEVWDVDYLLFSMLGLVVFAVFFSSYQTRLSHTKRNAARFDNMLQNFDDLLTERLEKARLASAQGNEKEVWKYLTGVHSIMSVELNDWVRLASLDIGTDTKDYAASQAVSDQSTIK